jgi:hypothetical protein
LYAGIITETCMAVDVSIVQLLHANTIFSANMEYLSLEIASTPSSQVSQ